MADRPRVLFVSELAGFAGGIERFIFQTAQLLRGAGFEAAGLFAHAARDEARFLRGFDRIFHSTEAA